MDRRRAVKMVRTPETSTIVMDDNTLLFNTPQKPRYVHKPIFKPAFETSLMPSFQNSVLHTPFRLLNYKSYIVNFVLLLVCLYQYNKHDTSEILRLQTSLKDFMVENVELKDKYVAMSNKLNNNKQVIDYATIDKCAYIDYNNTSAPYKYGLFSSKYKDPSIMLHGFGKAGECFAFKGCKGKVTILFKDYIEIKEILIQHPKTKDRSSALNEFKVFGIKEDTSEIIGNYEFNLDDKVAHVYGIIGDVKYKGITIEVLSNHGKANYTCIYKISVMGYRDD